MTATLECQPGRSQIRKGVLVCIWRSAIEAITERRTFDRLCASASPTRASSIRRGNGCTSTRRSRGAPRATRSGLTDRGRAEAAAVCDHERRVVQFASSHRILGGPMGASAGARITAPRTDLFSRPSARVPLRLAVAVINAHKAPALSSGLVACFDQGS